LWVVGAHVERREETVGTRREKKERTSKFEAEGKK